MVEPFEPAVYKEPNAVFANAGGVFQDVSAEAGLTLVKAHRGAAFADFDGDGRIDAVVSSLGEPAELWDNVSPDAAPLDDSCACTARSSNRDGIGASIRIGNQYAEMTTAVGYASSSRLGRAFRAGRRGDRSENRDPLAGRRDSNANQRESGPGFDGYAKIGRLTLADFAS